MLIPFDYLPTKKIKGIIHVGAHECEELHSYTKDCERPVIWIEANPQMLPIIRQRINSHKSMRVACFAASNHENLNAILNLASNGQSSSLLQFKTHAEDHPAITFIDRINIMEQRIDRWIEREEIDMNEYNFINLDIQGYELKALQGASGILSYIDYVYTEINIKETYKDCARLDEIDKYLSIYGFSRISTVLTRNGWGDAFYSKGNIFYDKSSWILKAIASKIRRKAMKISNRSNQ